MKRKPLSLAVLAALATFTANPLMSAITTDISNIIINEVLPDPNGSNFNFDTDGDGTAEIEDEFFEFYNRSTTDTVDISDMQFWDNQQSYTFPSGSVIPPQGYLIIIGDWDSPNAQPSCVVAYGRGNNNGFGNSGDVGVLYNPASGNYIGAAYGGDSVDNDVADTFPGTNKLYEINFGSDTDGQSRSLSVDGDVTSAIVSLNPPTPVMNSNCGNVNGDSTPIANANLDQTVDSNTTVTLDSDGSTHTGSASSLTTYLWEQTSGTTVVLSDVNAQKPTFIAPIVTSNETLSFRLTVTDNLGNSAIDDVEITVQPLTCQSSTTQTSNTLDLPSNQWIMFGLPLNPGTNNTIADIFDELPVGEFNSTWAVYEINNQTSAYNRLASTTSKLSQGKAYWIITLGSSVSITMSGTNTSTDNACYAEVPLYKTNYNIYEVGYTNPNAIGNPMNTTVSWSDFRVKTNASTYLSTADADTGDVIQSAFTRGPSGNGDDYEGGDVYNYDGSLSAGDIRAWEAIWVTAEKNTESGVTQLAIPE